MSTHFLLKHRVLLFSLVVLTLLLFGQCVAWGAEPGQLEVHFIDVGQGDSILVLTPGGRTMLIDAGDHRAGPDVVKYLKAQGVQQIDVLIGTHPHADHIGGLLAVLDSFEVKQVYDSGQIHTSKIFENYLKKLDAKNIPFQLARAGDKIDLAPQVDLTVLWPTGPRKIMDYGSLNEASIVLFLRYGKVGFLFTGDAGQEAELEMISGGHLEPAEVLKVGHHGSHSSSSREFLEAVGPQVAVIMCGAGNPYGHPHKEPLERLREVGATILRTDRQGTIVIRTDGSKYSIINSQQVLLEIGATGDLESHLININTASVEELKKLPGIGETLARRIIEYRLKVGIFTSPEDLLQVKGIGEKTLAKIRDLITL
ncbi:MAG: helix-hairpin-helix domain-containing protein [Firmicutes bacterium]|nr:helix-hairpin-helix domain-containing protein [Bacillota bacterium]